MAVAGRLDHARRGRRDPRGGERPVPPATIGGWARDGPAPEHQARRPPVRPPRRGPGAVAAPRRVRADDLQPGLFEDWRADPAAMDPAAAILSASSHGRAIAHDPGASSTSYGPRAGGLLANGLASLAALFAAIPMLLLALGVAGLLANGDPPVQRGRRRCARRGRPAAGRPRSRTPSRSLVSGAALTSVIGLVGHVWGSASSTWRSTWRSRRIWSDDPRTRRLPPDRARLRVGGDPRRDRDLPDRGDHGLDRSSPGSCPRRSRPAVR